MAKKPIDKFKNSKWFKEILGDEHVLQDWQIVEFEDFEDNVGFTHDRAKTLARFVEQGHSQWTMLWDKLKSLSSGDLETHIILYGKECGTQKYKSINKAKTRKFNHCPKIQKERAKKSAKKTKNSDSHGPRTLGYWINQGFTENEAIKKRAEFQTTNTLEKYIKHHGAEKGKNMFEERNKSWSKKMKDPIICKSRSLGLWRYQERYGDRKGKEVYLEMRRKRNKDKTRVGHNKASKQSISAFSEILFLLKLFDIEFYAGIDGKKEWFIEDKDNNKFFFYDLVIPSLNIIIEFHGTAFHPNPSWDHNTWSNWKQLYTGKSAEEVFAYDHKKKTLAENNGWTVFEMYSDTPSSITSVSNTVQSIIKESRS